MKKTKGKKLLNKIKKIKKKILKKYQIGTLVKYLQNSKIYTIEEHDRQDIRFVSVRMDNEYFWISIEELEIVKKNK